MRSVYNDATGATVQTDDAPVIEQSFDEKLAEVTTWYSAKMSAIRDQIVTALASDGTGMDTRLATLRSKYASVCADYQTALNVLYAE